MTGSRKEGRRVVITGLGAVTGLGTDLRTQWGRLLDGKSGVGPIARFDASRFPVRIAGEARDFNAEKWIEKGEIRKLDRFAQMAIGAAAEAVKDSGVDFAGSGEDPARSGVCVGSGIGGLEEIEQQNERLRTKGNISPFMIPKLMLNAAAGQISIRYGLKGPNFATASACASASHAIGDAYRILQRGEADLMLTGGSEAAVTPMGLGGFAFMKALSPRNDAPQEASRPFDRDRDGFVLAEGSAILVFEELEHARKRGARIYAEFLGFGMSADGAHITAPDPTGDGAIRCMRMALADARVAPEEVAYVNAHGTSTPLNDKTETLALKGVFGAHARKLAISSTKSMLGHSLGASGAIELVFTALTVKEGIIHPTINYRTPDPDCDLDYVPNAARKAPVGVAISNSFGFGGHNATVVIGRI